MKILRAATLAILMLTVSTPMSVSVGQDFDSGMAALKKRNYATALREMSPLAERGSPKAQLALAEMYHRGWGVTKDPVTALMWALLASTLSKEGSVPILPLFAGAIAKDMTPAQISEAKRRAQEQSSKWKLLANSPDAVADFRKAIAAFQNGDYTTAGKELHRLADEGWALAQALLAGLYEHGKGVPQDRAAATEWTRKAAEQGNAVAQTNLGAMYAAGLGVPRDYVQAYKWMDLAALQGGKNAVQKRAIVARKMTPGQIAEAERQANEWLLTLRPSKQ